MAAPLPLGDVAGHQSAIDDILGRMDAAAEKLLTHQAAQDADQTNDVKLMRMEMDVLKAFGQCRDFMTDLTKRTIKDRQVLVDIFGGDCIRITRVRELLDSVVFSDLKADDQRIRHCKEAADVIEKVLLDRGLAARMKEAVIKVKEKATARPKRLVRRKANARCAIDDDLVNRVLACTKPEELLALEKEVLATKSKKPVNWMIWMVHRAHLDDPSLVRFDFSNTSMPSANLEPRVATKLTAAMGTNTHIEEFLLPCSNFQSASVVGLAEALSTNTTLRVINLDTNPIQPEQLETLMIAVGQHPTLEEFRCNNQAAGLPNVVQAFIKASKFNERLRRFGVTVQDQFMREEVNKLMLRNNDIARRRRLEEKKTTKSGGCSADVRPVASAATPDERLERQEPDRIKVDGEPERAVVDAY